MIVRPDADGALLLRQTDHALLAGLFAKSLSRVPDPRGLFETAVRVHDQGWAEYDQAPGFDARTGLPYDYRATPDDPYLLVWRSCLERAYALDDYVGLLVASHGLRFFADKDRPQDQAFLHEGLARMDATLDALGLGGSWDDLPDAVQVHAELLRFLDGLSLFVCEAWPSPWTPTVLGRTITVAREGPTASDARSGSGRDRVSVDPWPFDQPIDFHVPARRLAPGPFQTEADLHAAMASAAPVVLDGVLTRPASVQ